MITGPDPFTLLLDLPLLDLVTLAETSTPLLLLGNTDKAVSVRSTRRTLLERVVIMMAMKRGLFLLVGAGSLTSCSS